MLIFKCCSAGVAVERLISIESLLSSNPETDLKFKLCFILKYPSEITPSLICGTKQYEISVRARVNFSVVPPARLVPVSLYLTEIQTVQDDQIHPNVSEKKIIIVVFLCFFLFRPAARKAKVNQTIEIHLLIA